MYSPVEYLLLGGTGAIALEAAELSSSIRRVGGWPWGQRGMFSPYIVATIIRITLGALTALALSESGQIYGLFAAFLAGLSGSLTLTKVAQLTANVTRFPNAAEVEDESAQKPFRMGDEPPRAKVILSRRSASIISAMSEPDIPEAIAADTGLSVSEVTTSLSYLTRRGYVSEQPVESGKFGLTSTGEIIRHRINLHDRSIFLRDELSDNETPGSAPRTRGQSPRNHEDE